MVYFQVDDILPFHHRIVQAGNAAVGLWVRAGAWSSGHGTDGFVPEIIAKQLGKPAEIKKLVATGLWSLSEGGYQFYRWSEDATGQRRQVSAKEVEERKRAARERKQKWREGRGGDADVPRDDRVNSASLARARSSTSTSTSTEGTEVPSLETGASAPGTEPEPTKPKVVVTLGEWARWWEIYPRHEAKVKAQAAYKSARLRGASTEELASGAQRYRDDPNREAAFTALPTTWLNQGRWDDDPLPPRPETSSPAARQQAPVRPIGDEFL